MRMHHHLRNQLFRTKHLHLLRDRPPRNGQDGSEHPEVEKDGAILGDLEMEEDGVDYGEEDEDGGEGAGDEGDEAGGKQPD